MNKNEFTANIYLIKGYVSELKTEERELFEKVKSEYEEVFSRYREDIALIALSLISLEKAVKYES